MENLNKGHFFVFGNIKNNERTIRKTWDEFRDALAMGNFSYDDIEKAKKCTFLKVYNDLFYDKIAWIFWYYLWKYGVGSWPKHCTF